MKVRMNVEGQVGLVSTRRVSMVDRRGNAATISSEGEAPGARRQEYRPRVLCYAATLGAVWVDFVQWRELSGAGLFGSRQARTARLPAVGVGDLRQ